MKRDVMSMVKMWGDLLLKGDHGVKMGCKVGVLVGMMSWMRPRVC